MATLDNLSVKKKKRKKKIKKKNKALKVVEHLVSEKIAGVLKIILNAEHCA